MLIRSSGPIDETFHLLTLGHTCHYLFGTPQQFALFDPGLSSHCPMLLKRMESSAFPIKALEYIFITHLHADRIAGIPLLKRQNRKAVVVGNAAMQAKLSQDSFVREIYETDFALSKDFQVKVSEPALPYDEFKSLLKIDKVTTDSEIVNVQPNLQVRIVTAPGHTDHSLAYQILPQNFMIVDEGFGYYRGKDLAAPGGDWNQEEALKSIQKVSKIEVAALCFPEGGVLTGQLIRKHFQALAQNTSDLFSECLAAHQASISDEEIRASVLESFYTSEQADPVLQANMQASFEAMWKQILAKRS
ncbi:MAG: MBL fold metallo-hydrolase [Deltaproteobacteria bacterium]|nr:MBL fold metallo-hydrolase [Deltaproteobacteria bacterium]